jgi:hypothetical protein
MRRWKRQQPEQENPHEQRLRDVVDMFVRDDTEKAAYLAFARELMAAERRPHTMHRVIPTKPIRQAQGRLRAARNLAGKQAGRDPSISLGVTNGRDPSQRTKRVVAKWFRRGLSGHKLWLLGEAVTRQGVG